MFENQKHLTNALRKVRRLNHWLARRHKGSKNWLKAKRKLARLHRRIANLRADEQAVQVEAGISEMDKAYLCVHLNM